MCTKTVSRVKEGKSFLVTDLQTGRFQSIGVQHNDSTILHSIYLKKFTHTKTCTVLDKEKLSGYCYYSLIKCSISGIIGILFYTYVDKTVVTLTSLAVSRRVQQDNKKCEEFKPLFILEGLDLYVYSSDTGSVLIIPNRVTTSSLVVT